MDMTLEIPTGAAILVVLAVVFLSTVAIGERLSDRLNSAPLELPAAWERYRPRILAGKWLVGVWFAAAAAALLLPGGPARLAGLLAFAAASFLVIGYRRSLAQQPAEALDERERSLQRSIYVSAYRILASAIGIAAVALMLAEARVLDLRLLPPADDGTAVLVALIFVWVAPSLVHAWLDPRPDEREEDDLVLAASR